MQGLSGSGNITSSKIIPLSSNAYAIVGKFAGNMTAFGQTMTSFGNEDAFVALYYPTSTNTQADPTLMCIFQVGGNGNDEFSTGDFNTYLYLGGSHNSSNTIGFKLYRPAFSVVSGQLPAISKSNSTKIGFLLRVSTFNAGNGNAGILANTTAMKMATITADDGFSTDATTSINGLVYGVNGSNSSVFVTGGGNYSLAIKGSNGAVTTLTNAFGPYVARFDQDLQHVTTAIPGDQTATLTGYGAHLEAVAIGNGFHVYTTGMFSGPLRPNVTSTNLWNNHFVSKISFSNTATSSWVWAQKWVVNNGLTPVAESKGLAITPNGVVVLNRANATTGATKRSYLVNYNMSTGALLYSKELETYANQNCLSYYNGSLFLGGPAIGNSIAFGAAPGPVATILSGSSGIYIATYAPSTGTFTRLWTGLSSALPTANCNSIFSNGCKILATGTFQGTLLGASSTNIGAFLATAETSSLMLNQSPVYFCPGVPTTLNITAQPIPTNAVWSTTGSGVTLNPNANLCTVTATASSPNNFFVNVSAQVGTCPRSASIPFHRASGCIDGETDDRYEDDGDINAMGMNVMAAPNPFSQTLVLSGIRQAQKVEILNMEGRTLYQNAAPDSEIIEIPTSDWPNGIYFYRAIGVDNQISVGKIIKQ